MEHFPLYIPFSNKSTFSFCTYKASLRRYVVTASNGRRYTIPEIGLRSDLRKPVINNHKNKTKIAVM